MRLIAFESVYGLQELLVDDSPLNRLFSFLKKQTKGVVKGNSRTVWGSPEEIQIYRTSPSVINALAGKGSHQRDVLKKLHTIVLRSAKPIPSPERASGKKVIRPATVIEKEQIWFAVDELVLTELRTLFSGTGIKVGYVLPAAPAIYFYAKETPLGATLLSRKESFAVIDFGFRHTIFVGVVPSREKRKVQFYIENRGIYDIVDKISIATDESFEKIKKKWLAGENVFYHEVKDLIEGAFSKGAPFLAETSTVMVSGVTMVPPSKVHYSENLFAELGTGAVPLSPFLLVALALKELGAKRVTPVITGTGQEDDNQFVSLISTYLALKGRKVKKEKRR